MEAFHSAICIIAFGCMQHIRVTCVQAYVKMYQGDELPEPKSMLQASHCHLYASS